MLSDILKFAVLGLGAGAVYGLTALGVVSVYRASGVLNFAAGAIGMVGAFIFYDQREAGHSVVLAFALALGFAVIAGVLMQVIMRALRDAPALSRLVATLAVFTVLFLWADHKYGSAPRVVGKLLPTDTTEILPGIAVGVDRIIVFGIGVLLTVVLTLVYQRTKFGRDTQAVAESRRHAAALGISPDRVAGANWVIACVLGVFASILIVNIAGLSVTGLALLIIPALAAALLGQFRSLPLTFAGGLLIGVLQSEIAWLQTYLSERAGHLVGLDGWADTVPFLIIVLVLVVRGRGLPVRGESSGKRPEITQGRINPALLLAVGLPICLILGFGSDSWLQALTLSGAFAIVLLSLVVVTGFTGQLSLAQMAFAGFGAWVAAYLVAEHGVSFPIAALAGVAASVPLGALVGLPSLRARGVNLAVVTLSLGVVVESQVLGRPSLTGSTTGLDIGNPSLFGISLDTVEHPTVYALLVVFCLAATAAMVFNLRHSRVGRRLIAVCANERAAASLGISVFEAKLYAFSLSAGIAAVGGILLVFMQQTAVFLPAFSAVQSIFAVVNAVIGGIGFVLGAVIGGGFTPGGFGNKVLGQIIPSLGDNYTVQLIAAIGLIFILIKDPNGLAHPREKWRRKPKSRPVPEAVGKPEVKPATLEAKGVGVRYGGVLAVTDVSLEVKPGEIVGLIGPNGAGKTTFIDAVTGFASSTGEVSIDGERVDSRSARGRAVAGLGRTFQQLELFQTMSVRENLQAAAEPRDRRGYLTSLLRPGRAELSPAAVHAVHELGLADDLDRRPNDLPHGRRRLVAIARAVAAQPSILLLDEPAAGLDEAESAELGHLIKRLAREWGIAVLLVEHDVDLVMSICDRVEVLDQGRKLASGTPEEVASDPAVLEAYLGESVVTAGKQKLAASKNGKPKAKAKPVEPLLRAESLHGGYGDIEVFRDVDLVARPGEIVTVLGPNGAGKTTLLLTLAGELKPLGGSVDVLDTTLPAPLHRLADLGLSLVPDDRGVIFGLSCHDNLKLGPGDVDLALQLFPELQPLLDRTAGLLSGGEQQMLALGRALSARPKLLLIDELSHGLAPLIVQRLLKAVREAADAGTAVVLVEQHAGQALQFADSGLVLRHGRVELSGTADELKARIDEIEHAYVTSAAPVG